MVHSTHTTSLGAGGTCPSQRLCQSSNAGTRLDEMRREEAWLCVCVGDEEMRFRVVW